MIQENQIQLISEFFAQRKNILLQKGEDYNSKDVLGIFKELAHAQHRTPEQVILQEIHKKILRLINLYDSGKQPKNESIEDNILDLSGYTDLLYCARNEKYQNGILQNFKKEEEPTKPKTMTGIFSGNYKIPEDDFDTKIVKHIKKDIKSVADKLISELKNEEEIKVGDRFGKDKRYLILDVKENHIKFIDTLNFDGFKIMGINHLRGILKREKEFREKYIKPKEESWYKPGHSFRFKNQLLSDFIIFDVTDDEVKFIKTLTSLDMSCNKSEFEQKLKSGEIQLLK